MNKILIYTSNPDKTPHSMADVVKFANETPKYRLANVELSPIKALRNAKEGDRLFTKKGNTIYIIKAFDRALNELCSEDKAYVEACNRKGMKCVNITAVRDVTHYEDWCSGTSKEVINSLCNKKATTGCSSAAKTPNNMNKSMKETLLAKIKSQFLPTRISGDDVRLTFNGEVAVINSERDGFRVISSTGELVEYPVEMTFEGLPVFTIARNIADIKSGDIVRIDGKYGKVSEVKGSKIYMISYNGTGRTKHAVTNALLGTTTIDVVVALGATDGSANAINPLMLACVMGKEDGNDFDLKDFLLLQAVSGNATNINGNLLGNPLMFLLLSEKKGDIDPMMFLLMGGNGLGNGLNGLTSNPLALMALLGDKKGGMSDMMETLIMASAFNGGNGLNLGNLFGGVAPAAVTPAPVEKKVVKKAPVKRAPRAKKAAEAPAAEA